MNRLKKYASLLLALVMALALAVPAMAGENVEGGEPVAPEENTETPPPTTSNIIILHHIISRDPGKCNRHLAVKLLTFQDLCHMESLLLRRRILRPLPLPQAISLFPK